MKKTFLLLVIIFLLTPLLCADPLGIFMDGIYDITIIVGQDKPQLITLERIKVKEIKKIHDKEFLIGLKDYGTRSRPTTAAEDEKVIILWDTVCFFTTSSRISSKGQPLIRGLKY